jgi:hypothetical protein
MMYANYTGTSWIVNYNPETGGYRGKSKRAIWNQINTNFAYARDMIKNGKVRFYVREIDGTCWIVIRYRNGKTFKKEVA